MDVDKNCYDLAAVSLEEVYIEGEAPEEQIIDLAKRIQLLVENYLADPQNFHSKKPPTPENNPGRQCREKEK